MAFDNLSNKLNCYWKAHHLFKQHQQREVPAWCEDKLCWSHNQLNGVQQKGRKASEVQFEEEKNNKEWRFIGRGQEKISLPLTAKCVFYFYERNTDLSKSALRGTGIFFSYQIFKIAASDKATVAVHFLYAAHIRHYRYIPKLLLEKGSSLKHTQKHKSNLTNNLHFFRKRNTVPH